MHATLRLATFALGVVVTTASVHGSEPQKTDTKTPVATRDTKTSAPAKGQEGAAKAAPATNIGAATPAAKGVTPAKLETAAAAAAAAAAAPRQGTVAATSSAPKEETIEEIVARVKRRLATERTPTRKASAPAAARSAPPAPRVTLVWRPYVVWPDELTAPTTGKSQPDAERDRVTLQWESDAR